MELLLKENKTHGDVLFPFASYKMEYHVPATILDCHWHDELEFLLLTEGEGVFQVGTRQYELKKDQALLMHGGEIHSGTSNSGTSGFTAIVFHPSFLNSNPHDLIQGKYINPILEKQRLLPTIIRGEAGWEKDVLMHLQEAIKAAEQKEYAYEMQIKAHLYAIFSILLRNSSKEITEPAYLNRANRLKEAIGYIQKNYGREIHISELSKIANMSEGHFCRFFKKIVLKTPVEYINYYRVMKAAALLKNTDRKLLDIAMEVGFNNFSYFIGRFRQHMRTTPSKYRKAMESEELEQ